MNPEARPWLVDFHAAAALDSFLPFFVGFGAGELTPRPSPGVSSAFGVGSVHVLGLIFASYSSIFSSCRWPLLSPETADDQGNLASHTVAQDCCVLCTYLF